MYNFTEAQINEILGYLSRKPYLEVHGLISMIAETVKAQATKTAEE